MKKQQFNIVICFFKNREPEEGENETTMTSVQEESTVSEKKVENNGCEKADKKANSSNNTNRRTKLFKNKRANPPRRYESTAPLVYKIHPQDYAFHRGFFLKLGDIIALRASNDLSNNQNDLPTIYFAQIRAFMCDQYGEKSAVITWLIPDTLGGGGGTNQFSRSITDFDLNCFVLGPAEEIPRPLDSLEFVCRPDNVSTAGLNIRSSGCRLRHRNSNSSNNDITADGFDYLNQYKSDMLRHKFDLEDLAAANFRIVTSKVSVDTESPSNSSSQCLVKHEFILSN